MWIAASRETRGGLHLATQVNAVIGKVGIGSHFAVKPIYRPLNLSLYYEHRDQFGASIGAGL